MILVDTNVLVRLFVNDDPDHHRRASAVFAAGGVLVPLTVILEAEWVLRSRFGYGIDEVAAAFLLLLGLPGVAVEEAPRLRLALALRAIGTGFADALHLAATPPGDVFLSFDRDRDLVRRARAAGLDAREP